jgi:predicted GH43/DUF377 family glycosyl hydrolase
MMYHGVRNTAAGALYRLGLALLPLDKPDHCLLRGDSWIFGPETSYERYGDVGNVTFPCGYTISPDSDTINLYYGAADTSIALATASLRELIQWLDQHGHICGDHGGTTGAADSRQTGALVGEAGEGTTP